MIEATGKHLTIKEIQSYIDILINEIEKELIKKKIKFDKVLPSNAKLKETVVNFTPQNYCKFLIYVSDAKEIDDVIRQKLELLKEYQIMLSHKIFEQDKKDYKQTILYFRKKGYSWEQIHRLFFNAGVQYSTRHIRRIANE